MSGEPEADGGSRRLTRRGLLAAVGAGAVAGCGSLGGRDGGSGRTIRTFELPDVDPDESPAPVVAPSVPVNVDSAYLAEGRNRVTGLLAELPTSLGPAEIPNGHVRTHLTDAADAATDGLDAARTARTGLVALQSLRDARERARYAAAGWAVVESGASAGPLRRERRRLVADARSVGEGYQYRGTEPVRAALVHARIETWLSRVTDANRPRTSDEGQLLTVAEWGGTAESARGLLDDVTHVDERYRASLPDDAGTVGDALGRAADALAADARSRRADLPPEPTAEEWGFTERVRHNLRRDLNRRPDSVARANGPAKAVVDLTDRLARFRALERVRDRIDAGEISRAESARDVRTARTDAYDALDAALTAGPNADLARTVLSDLSWLVSSADRDIERDRRRSEVSAASLDDVMENYVVATAVARATSWACRRTVTALETA